MIKDMNQSEHDAVMQVADLMITAAKTAPKASGKDTVTGVILTGEDKDRLSEAMREIGKAEEKDFMIRDAANVDNSICVVIIGCKDTPFGMDPCGMCGYKNCAEMKKSGGNCVFNLSDLGIAVGSAAAVAADNRIDNRVMYSAGRGAVAIGCLPENVKISYGIPLSVSSKSIYYDRGPGAVLL